MLMKDLSGKNMHDNETNKSHKSHIDTVEEFYCFLVLVFSSSCYRCWNTANKKETFWQI